MTRVKLIPLFYTSFIFLIVHSALAQNGIIDLSTLEIGVPVTIVVNGRKCTVTLDPSAPRGYWVEPPECDPIITTVEVDQRSYQYLFLRILIKGRPPYIPNLPSANFPHTDGLGDVCLGWTQSFCRQVK